MNKPNAVSIAPTFAEPAPRVSNYEFCRAVVVRRRDEILASADKRFAPDPEHYDALFARFRPVVGDADAAALAWLVATRGCAPVIPDYEAAGAVERLFARAAAE